MNELTKKFESFRGNETLTILCIEVVLVMMGMGLVSPILPKYASTFGVNMTMVGLLITIFGAARLLFDIPAGKLTDILGRRAILISGPVLLAVGSIGCGLSGSYWMFIGFRFIQGIGSAMHTTAAMIMLADISTPANRGQVMSLYQGSFLLGAGLGPVMGGFIAQYFGLAAPFFIYAFFAIFASIWAYLRISETRMDSFAESSQIVSDSLDSSSNSSLKGLKSLLQDPNFILICIVTFGIFAMRNGAQNEILPLLGAERLGLLEGQIGVSLSLVAIIQIFATLIAGKLSDQFGRKVVIVPGCIIAAVSLLLLAQSYSYWFLIFSCLVMGIGIGIAGSISSAYVVDIIPKKNYSIGMGTYRAIGDLGFVIGPVLMGWLADSNGFGFSLLFNSLFLFFGIFIFQLMAKDPLRYPNHSRLAG